MSEEKPEVEGFEAPISLRYTFAAGRATSQFLHSIKEGKLVGQRSPKTGKITIPPRGSDPETGVPTVEEVELGDVGTIISFTIVYIPIPGNPIMPPYAIANIVLDGSDQTFIHLVSECDNDSIEMGMKVKAVWKDQSEWGYAFDNIKYFVPTGEVVNVEELKAQRLKETEKYRHA